MARIRKVSIYVMVATLLALLSWDIYAFNTEENSTFSVIITDWYYANPLWGALICTSMGVLIGHWFVPARGSED